jgi:hypothetical protein
MKTNMLLDRLSDELGITVRPLRIIKYHRKGIIPTPNKVGRIKDYTQEEYETIKRTIILGELGVYEYACEDTPEELKYRIKRRIVELEKLIKIAKQYWA